MVATKARVPHLPVAPEEIVADGEACFRAGATVLHLHARDGAGAPDWRRGAYERFIPALRRACPGVVICVTTSGRVDGELRKRADVLELAGEAKPDMASLTLGSLNFRDSASVNEPRTIVALAAAMAARGIRPELEIFDTGMAFLAHTLRAEGLLPGPSYANLMMGSANTAPATAGALAHLVASLPEDTHWAAAGIGAFQLAMNAMAVFMGGHVRTGLEDSPYMSYASREPATNEALVARVVALAGVAGRRVATPQEARALLGVPAAT
jgi:uncharacterized protein (DUF849 family)